MVLRQLQPGFGLDQGQEVRGVAIDLVGRAEDEGGIGRMFAGRLEQVERADGIDPEVGLGVTGRPVMRRLGRGVDHQVNVGLREDPVKSLGVTNVEFDRLELIERRSQALADRTGGGLRSEEAGPHVVLDSDHMPAGLDQLDHRLGADQSAGAGDYGRLQEAIQAEGEESMRSKLTTWDQTQPAPSELSGGGHGSAFWHC